MSFRFTPEDFQWTSSSNDECIDIAAKANQLLDAHIATLPEVFQNRDAGWWPEEITHGQQQRRARLWGVEEIKQKQCEHTHIDIDLPVLTPNYVRRTDIQIKCSQCGKRLVAKWGEA